MSEEDTGTEGLGEGQADVGSDGSQTTDAAPGLDSGQPGSDAAQTTGNGPDAEDTFFDPRELEGRPELQAAYKQMQRAFTKRMQEMSANKQKIEAYDAFYSDPIGQIQKVAQQYGYNLTRGEAAQIQNEQQAQDGSGNQSWQPNSWDDVMQAAEQRVLKKLEPYIGQVKNLRKQSIESQLSEIDPTWQQYEDRMSEVVQKHPTLANDPATLYRMSVPQEVLESRATQAALRKLEAKRDSNQVSGTSTTTKTAASGLPDKPVSFQDAYEAAKKILADKGIRKQ